MAKTKLKVTQKASIIGRPKAQVATIKALGLGKVGQTNIFDDDPAIRGMIDKVRHLIEVEELSE
ncbi:MAG TPA: 50S ribosomal protein L30 [Clostridiales bacterium]|nr:50S ribosomal protein L30 [Clostridiales bacterium]